jgi:porin
LFTQLGYTAAWRPNPDENGIQCLTQTLCGTHFARLSAERILNVNTDKYGFSTVPCARLRLIHFVVCGLISFMLGDSFVSAQSIASHTAHLDADASDVLTSQCPAGDHETDSSWLKWSLPQLGGIHVTPVYYGEVFTNTRGGITTKGATQYLGLLNLGVEWDLDEYHSFLPGKFYLLAQNTHGQGISTDFVGDSQLVSNIDSFRNIMQVSEYWWEFDVLDSAVTVRLGKQDINTEFLLIDRAVDFIQSNFGLSPSTAYPTYAAPSMAAVALIQITESWQLKTGLWDAFASGGGWGFSGNDSVVAIGELECAYELADGTLPGVFAVGAVYESAGVIEGDPVSPVQEYIVQLEQLIYRESHGDDDAIQGLGAFAGYYPRFPGSQITPNSIGDSFVAGATYTGLLPSRDRDVLGTGLSWVELFEGGTNEETVVEVFYKAQITPRVRLQPDLQYVGTPSGIYRDALVAGVRFQVDF